MDAYWTVQYKRGWSIYSESSFKEMVNASHSTFSVVHVVLGLGGGPCFAFFLDYFLKAVFLFYDD